MTISDELERLARLREEGTLSEEEFASAKADLLPQPNRADAAKPLGLALRVYAILSLLTTLAGFALLLTVLLALICLWYAFGGVVHERWNTIFGRPRLPHAPPTMERLECTTWRGW